MTLRVIRRAAQFLVLLAAVVCAGPVSSPAGAPAPGGAPQAPPQRKAITIALQAEVNALTGGMNQTGILNPPSRYVHEFVNGYLTFRDQNDDVRPWIAAELPSVEAGTWKRRSSPTKKTSRTTPTSRPLSDTWGAVPIGQ